MKKLLSTIITTIIVTVIVWMTASFIEVTSKNLEPNPTYSNLNFFIVMENMAESLDN